MRTLDCSLTTRMLLSQSHLYARGTLSLALRFPRVVCWFQEELAVVLVALQAMFWILELFVPFA